MGPGTLAFGNYTGLGQSGTGVLKEDGKVAATEKMDHTIPFILQWDEGLDIGSDTLTGVNDADYLPPFTFTGKLNKVTLNIDRPILTPSDIEKLKEAQRNNRVSE
jgi:arylsulfatase